MNEAGQSPLKFLMVLNDMDWFWSHRLPLARGIVARGWDLHLSAAHACKDAKLADEKITPHNLPARGSSWGPLTHIAIVRAIAAQLRTLRPDIVHAITIRYAFYTALAARMTGTEPAIYTVAGLGTLFSKEGLRSRVIRMIALPLMRLVFRRPGVSIIFQNPDDQRLMLDNDIVNAAQTTVIRGSGVDISQFSLADVPQDEAPIVLLPSRLLKEKGIYEFVEAARRLKAAGVKARFQIAGNVYPTNVHSLTREQMQTWHDEGVIEWLGQCSDMPAVLASSTIIALPSYYGEGVPKVLLEAAAIGRPIITCDMPGCREAVEHDVNGLLIPPKDAGALEAAIKTLLNDHQKCAAYGAAGRARVEKYFEVSSVVERTMAVYDRALAGPRPLILLGMNEVNVEYMQAYMKDGHLPTLAFLTQTCPVIHTSSEKTYHELEPWIQWVSIHTGKPFSDHGVFRLGDVVEKSDTQIWEYLEAEQGVRVAAISPMNAANRAENPAFFVPDPWTDTKTTGGWLMKGLARAVSDAVNENATGHSKITTYFFVLLGVLRYSLIPRNKDVIIQILKSLRTHYQRAILLDQLLTDMFCAHWKESRPGFASLFLNGAAHLQHHYLFNSPHYTGSHKNPDWYMPAGRDPVLEGYKNYDDILAQMLRLPGHPRIIVATGLHQTPVDVPVYYWRLKHHGEFLKAVGIEHQDVHTRMSRDFLITFETREHADEAQRILQTCRDMNDVPMFEEIEHRGLSIFTTLTYPENIGEGFVVHFVGGALRNFNEMVAFVAIKNGEHNGQGYLIDTDNAVPSGAPFPITDIFGLITAHFEKEKAAHKKAA